MSAMELRKPAPDGAVPGRAEDLAGAVVVRAVGARVVARVGAADDGAGVRDGAAVTDSESVDDRVAGAADATTEVAVPTA